VLSIIYDGQNFNVSRMKDGVSPMVNGL
jgi:hypothetical protein